MSEYSPLSQLKLDGTDDPNTVSLYTALAVRDIHQVLHGNGKKGIVERVDNIEKRSFYILGGAAVFLFILNVALQILF